MSRVAAYLSLLTIVAFGSASEQELRYGQSEDRGHSGSV